NQKGALYEFSKIEKPIASKILKTECLRTLDRLRVSAYLDEDEYILAVEQFYIGLDSIELIDLNDLILDRAAASFGLPLGTLDAIHLTSALVWLEIKKQPLVFLTHDDQLGKAAKASGFQVLGC
ncbi:MAG: type II toxin-antitoxin system VapC family toxin, partial [Deltaproteobacteria bacterium]|nr:type II toxin-antitoxin system VapC family toxin [Deltaproteobacteria bacterium]